MHSVPPDLRRPRVGPASDDATARRRDLAQFARRITAAPPQTARVLSACLVLVRAVTVR